MSCEEYLKGTSNAHEVCAKVGNDCKQELPSTSSSGGTFAIGLPLLSFYYGLKTSSTSTTKAVNS
jgi:hypothetical protein